jgi:hypothetical protein
VCRLLSRGRATDRQRRCELQTFSALPARYSFDHRGQLTAFWLEPRAVLSHQSPDRTLAKDGRRLGTRAERPSTFSDRRVLMRRVPAFSAAACISIAALAVASPAQAGYYLIRYDNTGVCQVWNEGMSFKPPRWPSDYKVMSRPVPTFTAALAAKEMLRQHGRCTW